MRTHTLLHRLHVCERALTPGRSCQKHSFCAAHDITVDAVHLMALSEAPSSGFSGALQEHRTTLSFAFLDAAAGFYYVSTA